MTIFIAIEDVYGVEVVKKILGNFGYDKELKEGIIVVDHLRPCSSKMSRILKSHIKLGHYVIVIVNSECRDPNDVKIDIVNNHLSSIPNDRFTIIINTPCIEYWFCEILNLKNCKVCPCKAGPQHSLNKYCLKKYNTRYEKKFLHKLISDVLRNSELRNKLMNIQIMELLKVISNKLKT